MSASEEPVNIQVPVDWSGLAEVPTTYVNQFAVTLGPPTKRGVPDGIYLMLGSIAPPLILSGNEERRQAMIRQAEAGIKVEVHGRFYLTRERLAELINSLQTMADAYDKQEKKRDDTEHQSELPAQRVNMPQSSD